MSEAAFSNADSDATLDEIDFVFIDNKEDVMDILSDPAYHTRKAEAYHLFRVAKIWRKKKLFAQGFNLIVRKDRGLLNFFGVLTGWVGEPSFGWRLFLGQVGDFWSSIRSSIKTGGRSLGELYGNISVRRPWLLSKAFRQFLYQAPVQALPHGYPRLSITYFIFFVHNSKHVQTYSPVRNCHRRGSCMRHHRWQWYVTL